MKRIVIVALALAAPGWSALYAQRGARGGASPTTTVAIGRRGKSG